MAHELTEHDQMFYLSKDGVPWHGLGHVYDAPPASSLEAIEWAGLDWEVEKRQLFFENKDHSNPDQPFTAADHYAVVRKDIGRQVGLCKGSFHLVQNHEAFSFFDKIAGKEGVEYRVAGSLKGGRIIWILASLPDFLRIGRDDVLAPYLLLTNSHDGSLALSVMLSMVRVVCRNTLEAAILRSTKDDEEALPARQGEIMPDHQRLRKGSVLVKLYHAKGVLEKFKLAADFLSEVRHEYEKTQEVFQTLADTSVTVEQVEWFLNELEPDPPEDKSNARRVAARERLQGYFEEGPGSELPTASGTAWGLFNAASYYVDHHRGRLTETTRDKRERALHSTWFGSGRNYKRKALELSVALV